MAPDQSLVDIAKLRLPISFHSDDVAYPKGFDELVTSRWLTAVAKQENRVIRELHYFFCSDVRLKDINQKHLEHYDYTDVITFPYHYDPIEADVYISIDRIKENAAKYSNNDFFLELNRVIVHGLLHMCGHLDGTKEEKANMRTLEQSYLAMRI